MQYNCVVKKFVSTELKVKEVKEVKEVNPS